MLELKRYGKAIEAFGNIPRKDHVTWVQLAAAHAHLGDSASATRALTKARELRPTISSHELIAVLPYVNQEPLDHLLEGLRKAGWTE
jgi:hypothetical protein